VKAVEDAKDRSPDLRLFQPPSQKQAFELVFSGFTGLEKSIKRPWLNSCPHPLPESTVAEAGALTVAGQWRNFTAFPSILAITMVKCAAQLRVSSRDAMERVSMTSTFIAAYLREVKRLFMVAGNVFCGMNVC
jgi:hypothetical protein